MKVWSLKTRKEKPKTAMMQRKKKKEEAKETAAADKKVGVFCLHQQMIPVGLLMEKLFRIHWKMMDMMQRYFGQMKTVIRRYHRSSPFWTMKSLHLSSHLQMLTA